MTETPRKNEGGTETTPHAHTSRDSSTDLSTEVVGDNNGPPSALTSQDSTSVITATTTNTTPAPAKTEEVQVTVEDINHQVAFLGQQVDVERFSIDKFTSRLLTLWFWIILIIYPSVSRVCLQAINCRTMDHKSHYLVADYTIKCDSRYYARMLPAIVCALIVYPFGIPIMFLLILRFKRRTPPWDENLSFLFNMYKPSYWWFEVYELLRKLFLTGLIIFVAEGTATQIAIACTVCAISLCVHLRLSPYVDSFDDLLQLFSLAEILLMTYCGLLLKVSLSGADTVDIVAFDWVLLLSNATVVFVILPASFIIQGKQYLLKIKSWFDGSRVSTIRRESGYRGLCIALMGLAIWSSISEGDMVTYKAVLGIGISLLLYLPIALYFFYPVQAKLPEDYRFMFVLNPTNIIEDDKAGITMQNRNLVQLGLKRSFSRSWGSVFRLSQTKSIDESDRSIESDRLSDADGPQGGQGRWRIALDFYAWLVQMRRIWDVVVLVIILGISVATIDFATDKKGTKAARILVLGVCAFWQACITGFPVLKDASPPNLSLLRLTLLLLSIANSVLILFLYYHMEGLGYYHQVNFSDNLFTRYLAALLISGLCALYCAASIIQQYLESHYQHTHPNRPLKTKWDSVYGMSSAHRTIIDTCLMAVIVLIVYALITAKGGGGLKPKGPTILLCAIAFLLIAKPYKRLQELYDRMRLEVSIVWLVITGFVQSHERRGTDRMDRGGGGEEAKNPKLAAEVEKLRRRVMELEMQAKRQGYSNMNSQSGTSIPSTRTNPPLDKSKDAGLPPLHSNRPF